MTEPKADSEQWELAHAELVRIGKAKSALDWDEGRWLLVALRESTHVRLGFGSFVEYSERLLGHGPRTTEEKLRVAEALEGLPQIEQALKEGLLCWSAVREITRVATDLTEADWISAARHKTVREVERLVNGRKPGDRPSDRRSPRPSGTCFGSSCRARRWRRSAMRSRSSAATRVSGSTTMRRSC